ncbi:T4 beta protein [Kribbella amoyensis]|uniref:T4 beta protein n=1 Tax=Kribbella amoyensis TaxID=996641 RepID=A0A561C0N2_9ACTN|nr:hypothetical protein [Kribbella amoyensis]TWD84749.1 T4 beta protein [Kribbella amoyensis]
MTRPGVFRSLVALRAKLGELTALQEFDRADLVQPLLSLDHETGASTERLLERVVTATRKLHDRGRLVMLDATGMAAAPGLAGGPAALLAELADRLHFPATLMDGPVPFIPVVDTAADDLQLLRIGRLAEEMGVGCALRIRHGPVTTQEMDVLLERLATSPRNLDVVVDLAYVRTVDARRVELIARLVDLLEDCADFRSITLLAGSIPKSLDRVDQWEQPRFEERLWHEVVRAGATRLRFGDYGVVHPIAAPGFRRSRHISVKYSCADHWLYVREPIADPDADEARARTVQAVCRHLVDSGSFSGPQFSWGDRQFATAAGGTLDGLGSTTKPVAFATSHHLAYLVSTAA